MLLISWQEKVIQMLEIILFKQYYKEVNIGEQKLIIYSWEHKSVTISKIKKIKRKKDKNINLLSEKDNSL